MQNKNEQAFFFMLSINRWNEALDNGINPNDISILLNTHALAALSISEDRTNDQDNDSCSDGDDEQSIFDDGRDETQDRAEIERAGTPPWDVDLNDMKVGDKDLNSKYPAPVAPMPLEYIAELRQLIERLTWNQFLLFHVEAPVSTLAGTQFWPVTGRTKENEIMPPVEIFWKAVRALVRDCKCTAPGSYFSKCLGCMRNICSECGENVLTGFRVTRSSPTSTSDPVVTKKPIRGQYLAARRIIPTCSNHRNRIHCFSGKSCNCMSLLLNDCDSNTLTHCKSCSQGFRNQVNTRNMVQVGEGEGEDARWEYCCIFCGDKKLSNGLFACYLCRKKCQPVILNEDEDLSASLAEQKLGRDAFKDGWNPSVGKYYLDKETFGQKLEIVDGKTIAIPLV